MVSGFFTSPNDQDMICPGACHRDADGSQNFEGPVGLSKKVHQFIHSFSTF
jgi:hypothetical protein